MKTIELTLPAHWLSALINADPTGLEPEDEYALDAFTHWMLVTYDKCWPIDGTSPEDDNHPGFLTHHDARQFSPYAAECSLVTFDVTP